MKTLSYLLALLSLLLGLPLALAQEQTGRIIEKLVAEVDQQLTQLETLSQQHTSERERYQTQLHAQLERYKQTEDPAAKASVRGDLTHHLAQLNRLDAAEVKGTLKTVSSVLETLHRLKKTMQQSSQFNPDLLKEQQLRLSNYLRNAARMVKTLEAVDVKQAQATSALKSSLAMLYEQLRHPVYGSGGALERMNRTVGTMEEVAKQLMILENLLESERAVLTTAAHVQTVDVALLRLAQLRSEGETMVEIPRRRHQGILQRMTAASGPLNEGSAGLGDADWGFEPAGFEQILQEKFEGIDR